MGGNALKNTTTRRYERDEYLVLEKDVIARLKKLFPNSKVGAIQAYRTKPSFGDMDVLVESGKSFPNNWVDLIRNEFQPNEYVKNSNVLSFDVKELQVDIILASSENYEVSMNYYSWNDVSNFVGRVAHRMGFKYGHEGLVYIFRNGDYLFDTIVLTKDTAKALQFLGYDSDRYLQGFDVMEEAYEWASSTPYFNRDMFVEENRSHKSKIRDRKRANYREFCEWMQDRPDLPAYPWAHVREQGGPKQTPEIMERAFEFFPEFKVKLVKAQEEFDKHVKFGTKYNGRLVSELTGLTDKELGAFMKYMRTVYDGHPEDGDLREIILCKSDEEVKQFIIKEFDIFVANNLFIANSL